MRRAVATTLIVASLAVFCVFLGSIDSSPRDAGGAVRSVVGFDNPSTKLVLGRDKVPVGPQASRGAAFNDQDLQVPEFEHRRARAEDRVAMWRIEEDGGVLLELDCSGFPCLAVIEFPEQVASFALEADAEWIAAPLARILEDGSPFRATRIVGLEDQSTVLVVAASEPVVDGEGNASISANEYADAALDIYGERRLEEVLRRAVSSRR